MKFKLYNPFDYAQEDFAQLIMESWHYDLIKDGFEVRDVDSGELYISQLRQAPRGVIVSFPVTLQAGEEKTVHIQVVKRNNLKTAYRNDYVGSDRMMDLDVTSNHLRLHPPISIPRS
ncbi:hypothetical protein [Paenibacillus sp.]|uniref:hypothetical protein n=1 Tax=Paenibacillus sp. TaxID=58172 RepID=UPI0028ACA8CF|nr:hypothetical protein [Paenibacillus sp.]